MVNEQIINNSNSARVKNSNVKEYNKDKVSPPANNNFIKEKSLSGLKVDQNISEIKNNFNKSKNLLE